MTSPGGGNINLATMWIPVMPETSQLGPKLEEEGRKARTSFMSGFGRMDEVGAQLFEGMLHGLNRSDLPEMFDPLINAVSGKQALLIGVVSGAVSAGLDLVVKGIETMVETVEEGVEAAVEEVMKVAEQFEDIHQQLVTYTNASGEALEGLEKSARNVYGQLDTDTKNLGMTMGILRQQFQDLSDNELENLTRHLTEMGDRFGRIDPRQFSAALHQFGVEGKDADAALGTLIADARDFGVSVQTMMSDMTAAGPIFSDMGVNVNSAAEAIAKMEQLGLPATKAMTGLAHAAQSEGKDDLKQYILDVNDALNDMMKNPAMKGQAEQMMDKIFGARNWPIIQASLSSIVDALNGVGEAGNKLNLDKLTQDSQTLKEAWTQFMHEMETRIEPISDMVVTGLGGALDHVKQWFDSHQSEIIGDIDKWGNEFIDQLPQIKEFVDAGISMFTEFGVILKGVTVIAMDFAGAFLIATTHVQDGMNMLKDAENLRELDLRPLGDSVKTQVDQMFDEAIATSEQKKEALAKGLGSIPGSHEGLYGHEMGKGPVTPAWTPAPGQPGGPPLPPPPPPIPLTPDSLLPPGEPGATPPPQTGGSPLLPVAPHGAPPAHNLPPGVLTPGAIGRLPANAPTLPAPLTTDDGNIWTDPSVTDPNNDGNIWNPHESGNRGGPASITTADNRDHDDKVAKHDDRQEKHDDWQERQDADGGGGGPHQARTVDYTSAASPSGPDTVGPDTVELAGKYDVLPTTSGSPGGIGAPSWPGYHPPKAGQNPALKQRQMQDRLDSAHDSLDDATESSKDAADRATAAKAKVDSDYVDRNLPENNAVREAQEAQLAKDTEALARARHAATRAEHAVTRATNSLEEANMKAGDAKGGDAKGGGDKNVETLGKGLLSGMFEEMGFGDIFGKAPSQWGATKLLGGLAQWGLGALSSMGGEGGEGAEGGAGGGGGGRAGGAGPTAGGTETGPGGSGSPFGPNVAAGPFGRGTAPGPGGSGVTGTIGPNVRPVDPNGDKAAPQFHGMPVTPMQPGVHLSGFTGSSDGGNFQGYGGGSSSGGGGGGGDTGGFYGGDSGGLTPGSPRQQWRTTFPNYGGGGGGGGVQTAGYTAGGGAAAGSFGAGRPGAQLAAFKGGTDKASIAKYIYSAALSHGYNDSDARNIVAYSIGESGLDPGISGGVQRGKGDPGGAQDEVKGLFQEKAGFAKAGGVDPDQRGGVEGNVTAYLNNLDKHRGEQGDIDDHLLATSVGGPMYTGGRDAMTGLLGQAQGLLGDNPDVSQYFTGGGPGGMAGMGGGSRISTAGLGGGSEQDDMGRRWQAAIQRGAIGANGELAPGTAAGSEEGLQTNTIRGRRILSALFPELQTIGGRRDDALKWHPQGLALDLMIPGQGQNNDPTTPQGKVLGDEVNNFITQNAGALGSDYTMWQQKDHYNHVHGNFAASGYPQDPRQQYFLPPGLMPHYDKGGSTDGREDYGPDPISGTVDAAKGAWNWLKRATNRPVPELGPLDHFDQGGAEGGRENYGPNPVSGTVDAVKNAMNWLRKQTSKPVPELGPLEHFDLGGVPEGMGLGKEFGSGDSQPAMLKIGEHVLTAEDVQAMGGQSAVYKFRQNLHRGYDAGGGGDDLGSLLGAGSAPKLPGHGVLPPALTTPASTKPIGPNMVPPQTPQQARQNALQHERMNIGPFDFGAMSSYVGKPGEMTPSAMSQLGEFGSHAWSEIGEPLSGISGIKHDIHTFQNWGQSSWWDRGFAGLDAASALLPGVGPAARAIGRGGDALLQGASNLTRLPGEFRVGSGAGAAMQHGFEPGSEAAGHGFNVGDQVTHSMTGQNHEVVGITPDKVGVKSGDATLWSAPQHFSHTPPPVTEWKPSPNHWNHVEGVMAMKNAGAISHDDMVSHVKDNWGMSGLDKLLDNNAITAAQWDEHTDDLIGQKFLAQKAEQESLSSSSLLGSVDGLKDAWSDGLINSEDFAHNMHSFAKSGSVSFEDISDLHDAGYITSEQHSDITDSLTDFHATNAALSDLLQGDPWGSTAPGAKVTQAGPNLPSKWETPEGVEKLYNQGDIDGPEYAALIGKAKGNPYEHNFAVGDYATDPDGLDGTGVIHDISPTHIQIKTGDEAPWWTHHSLWEKSADQEALKQQAEEDAMWAGHPSQQPAQPIERPRFYTEPRYTYEPPKPGENPRSYAARPADTNWAEQAWQMTRDANPLTDAQYDTVRDYTSGSMMNSILRDAHRDSMGLNVDYGFMSRSSDYWRDQISLMDEAMKASPRVPEDIVVNRSMGPTAFGGIEPHNAEDMLGKSFFEPGLLSTSVGKPPWGADYKMELHVPEGTQGMYLSHSANPISVFNTQERELLLGRGVSYEPFDVRDPAKWGEEGYQEETGFSKIIRARVLNQLQDPQVPYLGFEGGGGYGPDPVSGTVDAVKNAMKWIWKQTNKPVPELGPLEHLETGGIPDGMGIPKDFGSGDSHPAMLKIGEHVLTAEDVAAMGGQQSVYKFRQELHKNFEDGGDGNINPITATPHYTGPTLPGPSQSSISTGSNVNEEGSFMKQTKQNFVSGVGGILAGAGADFDARQWQGILHQPEWSGVQHQHQPVQSVQPINYDHSINISGNTIANPQALAQQMQESQNSRFYTAAGGLPMSGIGSP